MRMKTRQPTGWVCATPMPGLRPDGMENLGRLGEVLGLATRLRAIDRFVMAVTSAEARALQGAPITHAPELPASQRERAMATRSASKPFAFSAIALVLAAAILPARAQEVETGTVMICDSQKQVERFVTLFDGNPQTAIGAVNAEEKNPTACAVANIAYLRGPQIGMARTRTDAFQIIPIIAVGVLTPAGLRSIAPAPFFTLVSVKEYAV